MTETVSMDHIELLQRLGVALSIGLLVGIERGRMMLSEAEGERTAGLRTFALTGLLGGVAGALAVEIPSGAVVLAAALVCHAAILGLYRYREVEQRKSFGTTTVIAGLVTFALGALAIVVEPVVAGAAGVAATALLAMKSALHGWLKTVTWEEMRAGLLLLAMTLILLPVLPDKGYGPFSALNPYDLWRMTILIAAVSSLGYLAMKWVGGGQGIALSGLAGGLVSSTATTLSFARMARDEPAKEGLFVAGALLAGATMTGRILVVSGSIAPGLLRWLLLPLAFAGLALAGVAAVRLREHANDPVSSPLNVKNPFELSTVLKFGALLAAMLVAAKALTLWAGNKGAFALAAVSGIADVDAVTLSMSQLAGKGLEPAAAAGAILLAAAVNTVSKAVMGWMAGGPGPGRGLAIGAVAAIAAGAAGFALAMVWDPMQTYNSLPAAV
ncbi:MAG: MgtC/SapB family protein [Hyphomicrobium sp.]